MLTEKMTPCRTSLYAEPIGGTECNEPVSLDILLFACDTKADFENWPGTLDSFFRSSYNDMMSGNVYFLSLCTNRQEGEP